MTGVTPMHLSTVQPGEEPDIPAGHFLLEHLKSNAANVTTPVQVVAEDGATMSYPALLAQSVRAAAGWRALGLRSGDLLAVYSWNRGDLLPALLGAIFEGIAVVLVVPFAKPDELRQYLSSVTPKVMISEPSLLSYALAEASASTKHVVMGTEKTDNATSLEDVLCQGDELSLDPTSYRAAVVPDTLDHISFITYSSGTTGLNKAVVMTNRSLSLLCQDTRAVWRTLPGERVLVTHPLAWLTGLATSCLCVACGTTIVLSNFTDEHAVIRDIQRYKVTSWHSSPSRLLLLAQRVRELRVQRSENVDLASLRYVKSTGAVLGAPSQRTIEATLGVPVIQVYGCTELGIMASYPVTDVASSTLDTTPGATGRICAGVKLRLVDATTGKDVAGAGVSGEVRAITPYGMKGYADAAVPPPWDEQGFYCTGDIAFLDAGGELHIVDRIKELITFDEFDVAPAEIESVLCSHRAVKEACVVGRSHPVLDELPTAFVVLRPGTTASATELQDLVEGRLADHKRLRGGVHFVDVIPKSTYGKVLRSKVKEMIPSLPAVKDEDLK